MNTLVNGCYREKALFVHHSAIIFPLAVALS